MQIPILIAFFAMLASIAMPPRPAAAHESAWKYTSGAVNVRTAPTTAATAMGRLEAGEQVRIWCQDRGLAVNGTSLWDFVQYKVSGHDGAYKYGWVSDYYVKTGTTGPLPGIQQGNCPHAKMTVDADLAYGGSTLASGRSLITGFGYTLAMQTDGNLVLSKTGSGAVWATRTHGNPGAYMRMQSDGNLVVYSVSGRALWASGSQTFYKATSRLDIQRDGNLVIYEDLRSMDPFHGRACWSRYGGLDPLC